MAEISMVGEKNLPLNSGKQVQVPKVLPLWCDLELLKVSLVKERTCYFFVCLVKILFFPLAFPVLGLPAVWCAG